MQAIKFKNFTDRDFSWKYDGIEYNFPAGQETYLEDFKAKHFAKHLIDRELTTQGIRTDSANKRAELEVKCFPGDAPVSVAKALDMEEKHKEIKRRGRPKKVVEEEFTDLKETNE